MAASIRAQRAQRAGPSAGLQVRQAVEALCGLLAASGLEHVPAPDTIRGAKFGGGAEVEDEFWLLLANIFQTAGIACYARQEGAPEHRRLVAAGLRQSGYHADWMCLMEDGGRKGARVSGRELLLAFGWLVARGTLEKLLTQRVVQLDKTLLTPPPVKPQLSRELQLDPASLSKLQWLIGRLRYQGRSLLSGQDEQTRLLHAVLFAIPSAASSNQSSMVLMEDRGHMQRVCVLLEAYLNWKHVEKVFWTWMDSVVDCHLMDPVVKEPANRSTGVCHHRPLGPEDGQGNSGLPPLSSLQAFQVRLQAEKPGKGHSHPAKGLSSWEETPDLLPVAKVTQLLHHTEALLLERRSSQRLANREKLQEMMNGLNELVLIPP